MTTPILTLCLGLLLPLTAYTQAILQHVRAKDSLLLFRAGQPVRLRALDNDVRFVFRPVSATSTPGDTVLYGYQLEGFDAKEQQSPYPEARYTNLIGNDFVLHIRVRTKGQWSAPTTIPVSVERELTEEWWFIPAVIGYIVLLLGAAIYFFLLYNFRQKLKVQAIRYRIAADLHDEVGATLSSIAISTRLAQKKVGDSRPDVQSILDTIQADSEETIYTIRDTIWAINPDNDSPEKLFEKMRSFAFQVLTPQDIALDYDNQIPIDKNLKMSMEQRRNVYLMVKEAVNNMAKHSGATKASIQISRTDEGIRFVISDNGVGFDMVQAFEGNGLKNFRTRADESFITLTMHSAPGQGTELRMVVPEL